MTTLSLIAALSNNYIIGKNNQLPWHLPADLKYFKKILSERNIENKTRPIDYNTRKYTLDFSFFKDIDTEEKAYLLGLIASDGHIRHTHNQHKIQITLTDLELLEKFKKCINANNKIDSYREKGTHQIQNRLTISSVEMIHDLERYKLSGRKSRRTHIPKEIPYNLIKHFIRGYFDGDGSISIDKRRRNFVTATITSSSQEMLQQIQSHLKENNLIRNGKDFIEADNRGNCWYIRLSKREEILNFLGFMYKDSLIFMERKMKRYLEFLDRPIRIKPNSCLSKYYGVYLNSRNGKQRYRASIKHDKKNYVVGVFDTELEAVIAYNLKVKELGLPEWRLNKIGPAPIT